MCGCSRQLSARELGKQVNCGEKSISRFNFCCHAFKLHTNVKSCAIVGDELHFIYFFSHEENKISGN